MLLLVRLASKQNDRPKAPKWRTRRGEAVAFLCPECGVLGTATEVFTETRHGALAKWRVDRSNYECAGCRKSMGASAFENDGNGVMQARRVECRYCQTVNPGHLGVCRWCGKVLL